MSTDRDVTRVLRSWLDEGVNVLPDRVLDAVLDQVPATPQRRASWLARRIPLMKSTLRLALAVAAVLVVAVIGYQFLGGPNAGGPVATPTPEATPTSTPAATPTATPVAGLPLGPFLISDPASGDVPFITVTIPAPGWNAVPEVDGLAKGEDADPPEAFLVAWSWPTGTEFTVYGDPCHWESTRPDTTATTVEEIVAALAAQASRDASAPVDVTLGGHDGKMITLHVPNDAVFSDCDQQTFASYGTTLPGDDPSRFHQGPGQVDELWVLNVNATIVIIDAMYRPSTPAELINELRAIAQSATFAW